MGDRRPSSELCCEAVINVHTEGIGGPFLLLLNDCADGRLPSWTAMSNPLPTREARFLEEAWGRGQAQTSWVGRALLGERYLCPGPVVRWMVKVTMMIVTIEIMAMMTTLTLKVVMVKFMVVIVMMVVMKVTMMMTVAHIYGTVTPPAILSALHIWTHLTPKPTEGTPPPVSADGEAESQTGEVSS